MRDVARYHFELQNGYWPFLAEQNSILNVSLIFSPVCGKGEKRPRVLSRSDWKKALVKMRKGDEKYFKAIAENNKVWKNIGYLRSTTLTSCFDCSALLWQPVKIVELAFKPKFIKIVMTLMTLVTPMTLATLKLWWKLSGDKGKKFQKSAKWECGNV